MKLKIAIIYGVTSWILIYIISNFLSPFIIDNVPYIDLTIPITIIVVTTFFGILYIRNYDDNEVVEGFKIGIVFFIVDLICDMLFFIVPGNTNVIVDNYPLHLISMVILIPLITTFLGYLAHMKIELT